LYQLVYGRPPFAQFPLVKKLAAIINPSLPIEYPESRHKDPSLFAVLKGCLHRDPKQRLTIPQLMEHSFLNPSAATIPYDTVYQLLESLKNVDMKNVDMNQLAKVACFYAFIIRLFSIVSISICVNNTIFL
jgi:serine/threonine protein kinase